MINTTIEVQIPSPVNQGTTPFTVSTVFGSVVTVSVRSNNVFLDMMYQGGIQQNQNITYHYLPIGQSWDDETSTEFLIFYDFVPVPSATYVLILHRPKE